jgi:hypothetical protein
MQLLLIVVMALAIQARLENGVIILFTMILFFLYKNRFRIDLNSKRTYAWLLLPVLILPHIILVQHIMNEPEDYAPYGSIMDIEHLNEKILILDGMIQGIHYPLIFNTLFILGSMILILKNRKMLITVYAWILLFTPIHFAFHTTPQRFLVTFYFAFITVISYAVFVLADYGQKKIIGIFQELPKTLIKSLIFSLLILIFILVPVYPYVSEALENPSMVMMVHTRPQYYHEISYINELKAKIPNSCYIVAYSPTRFADTDFRVVEIYYAVQDTKIVTSIINKSGCVLYFEGLDCTTENTVDTRTPRGQVEIKNLEKQCTQMHEKYRLEPLFSYNATAKEYFVSNPKEEWILFTVYNITGVL